MVCFAAVAEVSHPDDNSKVPAPQVYTHILTSICSLAITQYCLFPFISHSQQETLEVKCPLTVTCHLHKLQENVFISLKLVKLEISPQHVFVEESTSGQVRDSKSLYN